jgi:hypothetical protein
MTISGKRHPLRTAELCKAFFLTKKFPLSLGRVFSCLLVFSYSEFFGSTRKYFKYLAIIRSTEQYWNIPVNGKNLEYPINREKYEIFLQLLGLQGFT